ncbi:MAG: hypothetical protein KDB00_21165 [Planctomycetales bacterium]|nr:hypothetical protein [Planctomycetales bacterium]
MSNFEHRLPAGWKVWSQVSHSKPDSHNATDPRWMRELDQIAGTAPKRTRSVPIKLLAPLLIDAHQRNSTWLNDFADDVVVIDADLHEVLLAYQKIHKAPIEQPSADSSRTAAA